MYCVLLQHWDLIHQTMTYQMIVAALRGDNNQQLKQLSDAIINSEQNVAK